MANQSYALCNVDSITRSLGAQLVELLCCSSRRYGVGWIMHGRTSAAPTVLLGHVFPSLHIQGTKCNSAAGSPLEETRQGFSIVCFAFDKAGYEDHLRGYIDITHGAWHYRGFGLATISHGTQSSPSAPPHYSKSECVHGLCGIHILVSSCKWFICLFAQVLYPAADQLR